MEIISGYNIVKDGEHSPVKDFAIERAGGFAPQVGIVLGSGLGALTEAVESPVIIPYRSIPGFPAPTVAGHKGNMILGTIAGKRVAVMDGRFHYYEGHPSTVTDRKSVV